MTRYAKIRHGSYYPSEHGYIDLALASPRKWWCQIRFSGEEGLLATVLSGSIAASFFYMKKLMIVSLYFMLLVWIYHDVYNLLPRIDRNGNAIS
jgi:hypothetical protein